jgi:hypothetical protein
LEKLTLLEVGNSQIEWDLGQHCSNLLLTVIWVFPTQYSENDILLPNKPRVIIEYKGWQK